MSGILLGRPAGIDDGLDLDPPTFGLLNQLTFLEDYCAGNASMDFGDAVEALYKRLRREGKTNSLTCGRGETRDRFLDGGQSARSVLVLDPDHPRPGLEYFSGIVVQEPRSEPVVLRLGA
jgi:hypothetical protein